jgi:hypothetical protein
MYSICFFARFFIFFECFFNPKFTKKYELDIEVK